MTSSDEFRVINARRVATDDGTEVYLVNADELSYSKAGRTAVFPAERIVDDDGAPAGRLVSSRPPPTWSDGERLSPEDLATAFADIRRAADLLRTKFEFD